MPLPENKNSTEVNENPQQDSKESKKYVPTKEKTKPNVDQAEFDDKKAAELAMILNQTQGMSDKEIFNYIENKQAGLETVANSDSEKINQSAEIAALLEYIDSRVNDPKQNATDISKYISVSGYFKAQLSRYKVLLGVPGALLDNYLNK